MDAHQFSPHPNQKEVMTSHLPEVTSTPEQRLDALREAKALLFVPTAESNGMFGKSSSSSVPATMELMRLAEYITAGHDYLDTHPKGKRRPIIQNVNVHAVGMPEEVAKKLISDDFLDDLMNHVNGHEDEPEHRPVDPQDRPRFNL